MAIVAYRYIPPCFDSRYGESNWTTILPNLPPENRELFLINELHKIKNPFLCSGNKMQIFKYPTSEQTLCIVHTE